MGRILTCCVVILTPVCLRCCLCRTHVLLQSRTLGFQTRERINAILGIQIDTQGSILSIMSLRLHQHMSLLFRWRHTFVPCYADTSDTGQALDVSCEQKGLKSLHLSFESHCLLLIPVMVSILQLCVDGTSAEARSFGYRR